jgi:hypothetical protein
VCHRCPYHFSYSTNLYYKCRILCPLSRVTNVTGADPRNLGGYLDLGRLSNSNPAAAWNLTRLDLYKKTNQISLTAMKNPQSRAEADILSVGYLHVKLTSTLPELITILSSTPPKLPSITLNTNPQPPTVGLLSNLSSKCQRKRNSSPPFS